MKPTPLRKIFLFLLAFGFQVSAFAQYWQQQVDYTIEVSLNDKLHTLDGFEKIVYTNNSPDTLKYIWFHLWPNAYKNDKTAYTDQARDESKISVRRLKFCCHKGSSPVLMSIKTGPITLLVFTEPERISSISG